jgi:hypothetical protein
MEPVVVFFMLGLLLVLVIAVIGARYEMARRRALAELAQRLGLRLATGRNKELVQRYKFLDWFQTGSNRYAENVVSGSYRGHEVLAFDYHYETYSQTKKGRETHHHWSSFYILLLPLDCPEFHLYPETFLSRIGHALGAQDIDFESDEFSRAFVVKCANKKFAYDVCHARMMEFLLRHPRIRLEIERNCLAAGWTELLQADQLERRLNLVVEIRELLPEYLLQQG